MNIESFWNQAFIASLSRLPAEEAREEADKATELCIAHWQSKAFDLSPDKAKLWQEQAIARVPEVLARAKITRIGNVRVLVFRPLKKV